MTDKKFCDSCGAEIKDEFREFELSHYDENWSYVEHKGLKGELCLSCAAHIELKLKSFNIREAS